MNRILETHSSLLVKNLEDFARFNFERELAERLVYEEKLTLEEIFADKDKLGIMFKRGVEMLPLVPVFEEHKGKLELKSRRFFEMIRFSLATSSFVKGIDQFSCACRISELDCPQFAAFAYYSSIFHLIHSFVTIHGRVYIPKTIADVDFKTEEKIIEKEKVREIIKIHPKWNKFVKGMYSKNHDWLFQNVGVGHAERWKDFADILKLYIRNNWRSQIPDGIIRFWGYMKVLEEYKKNFYKPHMKYSIDFSSDQEIIDTLNNCYSTPVEVRHQKIYENRRYDLMASSYWKVGKTPSESFVEAELSFFKDCNVDLLKWQYRNLKECLSYVQVHCSEKKVYYKGLNAITGNPYLASDLIALQFILESKEVAEIDKNLPEFVKLLLS